MTIEETMYCTDCLNVFKKDDLEICICTDCFGNKFLTPLRIVTRYGIKQTDQIEYVHCKECLRIHHQHNEEAFI